MKKILLTLFIFIYSIVNAQVVQIKKLVPADAVTDGRFGVSVAIDGEIAITGAYWDDNNGFTAAGAVYVHYRNQGGTDQWGVVKKIIPSDPSNSKLFGWQVHLDNNILVVGAPTSDWSDGGSAYVFYKDAGGTDNWGEIKKLTASDAAAGDEYGVETRIQNDIIVVGAHRDNNGVGSEEGSAYIYYRNQGGTDNWGEVKKIAAGDPDGGELFGYSIDLDGDIMAVGAYHDKNTVTYGGAVYIFEKNSGGTDNWGQTKKITTSVINTHDKFGIDVDLQGTTLAVGSWWHTHSSTTYAGAAYIFDQNEGGTNNWGLQKKITVPVPNSWDWFGGSLALDGDNLLIGAERDDLGSTTNGGGMYLFGKDEGGTGNWGLKQEIKSDDMANNDRFGRQVAISGDYIIAGSYFADHSSLSNPGASYIFGPAVQLNTQSIELIGKRLNPVEILLEWQSVLSEEMYEIEILYSKNTDNFESLSNQTLYGLHNSQKIINQGEAGYYQIRATNIDNGNVVTSNLIYIDNKVELQMSILPNPFQDFVQLQMNTNENLEFWVYDSQGKLIASHKGNVEQVNAFLRASSKNWSKGMYLFTVLVDGQTFREKMIKN